MRWMNVVTALIFAMVVCLSASPVNSFAKTDTKGSVATGKKAKNSNLKAVSKNISKKSYAKAKIILKPRSVSINSANKALLIQLPGIGEKTADAIIKYRRANGKFRSIDDLKNVKGIGDKKISKMKKYLKL